MPERPHFADRGPALRNWEGEGGGPSQSEDGGQLQHGGTEVLGTVPSSMRKKEFSRSERFEGASQRAASRLAGVSKESHGSRAGQKCTAVPTR